MKILLVIDSLVSGGAQRQMTLLATGLVKRNHNVDLFLYYPRHDYFLDEVERGGVRVIHGNKKHRFDFSPMLDIRRALASNRYDAAAAFLPTPSYYLVAARGLRRLPRLTVSERSSSMHPALTLTERIRALPYLLADRVVPNSYLYAHQLAVSLPPLRSKIAVISNAVPDVYFAVRPREHSNVPLSLLALGRVGQEKNPVVIAEALAILRDRHVPLPHIRWAGRREGSAGEQSYAAQLERQIDKLELNSYWHWLGERKDIPALIESSDALILASHYEGTPNAVCEALAAGRPVIGSSVGDIARLLEHGRSGLLFDPHSPRDLADALQRFVQMSDPERRRLGENARAFASKELSSSDFVRKWEQLLSGSSTSMVDSGG